MTTKRRFSIFVLSLFAVLGLGCGDDGGDGTTGPGSGSGNSVAAGFGAVADAYAGVVTANAATYASVNFFGPSIRFVINNPPPLVGDMPDRPGSALQSCLPPSTEGVVFAYDTEAPGYVPTKLPGAPEDGARFILYELDTGGSPRIPLVEDGFVEIRCGAAADTVDIDVVNGAGVAIFEAELNVFFVNAPSYIIGTSPVTLRDPLGGTALELLFVADGQIGLSMGPGFSVVNLESFDSRAAGIRASAGLDDNDLNKFGLPVPPYFQFGAGVSKLDESENLEWAAGAGGSVDGDGTLLNIQQGPRAPLEFEDYVNNTNGVLACISGYYRDPLVDSASSEGGCATGAIQTPIPLSSADLSAIHDGYVALTNLLETMSTQLAVGLDVVVN